MKITQKILSSGLRLVSVPLESESVSVMCLIRAGSRDEDDQRGVAHFLEHFVFKGTSKYPKVNDITREIDGIGGKMNAFTWYDVTGFWVKVAAEKWEKGVEVVSELVCEPLLPKSELAKEKGAIVEELRMYEDDHKGKAMDEFENMIFPNSSLGRQILGTEGSIKAMKIVDLENFRNRWYSLENMVVVAVGKLPQARDLEKSIEEKFRTLRGKKQPKERIGYDQIFTQEGARVKITKRKTEQAHLALGVRAYKAGDERNYIVWVMNQLLGANMSSRLWDEVREKRGLAYYVGSAFYSHQDQGVFVVRAGVALKDVKQAIEVIKDQLLKLSRDLVGEEELVVAKAGAVGSLKLDIEDSVEVAEMLAFDWALRGEIRDIEEMVAGIQGVTAEQIKSVASELFKKERFNLSVTGAIKESEKELEECLN